jgi:hypothetical protein
MRSQKEEGKKINDRQTRRIGSQNEEGKKEKNDRQTRRMGSQNEEGKSRGKGKDVMAKNWEARLFYI